jgi:hypothetical protein
LSRNDQRVELHLESCESKIFKHLVHFLLVSASGVKMKIDWHVLDTFNAAMEPELDMTVIGQLNDQELKVAIDNDIKVPVVEVSFSVFDAVTSFSTFQTVAES